MQHSVIAKHLNGGGPSLQPATKGARAGSRAIANPALAIKNIARMGHPQRGKLSEGKRRSKIKRVGHRPFAYHCTLFAQNGSYKGRRMENRPKPARKSREELRTQPLVPYTLHTLHPPPLSSHPHESKHVTSRKPISPYRNKGLTRRTSIAHFKRKGLTCRSVQ
jgi:hypothetical protein